MPNLLWFVLVICVVALLFAGLTGAVALLIYLTVRNRRPEDVSAEQIEPPAPAQPLVDALVELGFRRLGESRTRLPLPGVTGTTWILVDGAGTTQAEIVAHPPMLALTSVYSDEAVVETGYPLGERIDTPRFRAHVVGSGVAEAYQHHLAQAADFGATHGAPQPIASMADYAQWDRSYRLNHAQRKMRRLFIRNGVLPLAGAVYLLGAGAFTLLAGWWRQDPEAHLFPFMLLLAPGLAAIGAAWVWGQLGSGRPKQG